MNFEKGTCNLGKVASGTPEVTYAHFTTFRDGKHNLFTIPNQSILTLYRFLEHTLNSHRIAIDEYEAQLLDN